MACSCGFADCYDCWPSTPECQLRQPNGRVPSCRGCFRCQSREYCNYAESVYAIRGQLRLLTQFIEAIRDLVRRQEQRSWNQFGPEVDDDTFAGLLQTHRDLTAVLERQVLQAHRLCRHRYSPARLGETLSCYPCLHIQNALFNWTYDRFHGRPDVIYNYYMSEREGTPPVETSWRRD